MRVLKFIVDNRGLRKDPTCNFTSTISGDKNSRVRAEFAFSPEWESTSVRVAGFWSKGIEYPPQVLIDGKTCMIPTEVLSTNTFELQILGKKNTATMKTNKLQVRLNGGVL